MTRDQILMALRVQRESLTLTQREVSIMLGLSGNGPLSEWETGKVSPTLPRVVDWARVLGLHVILSEAEYANDFAVRLFTPRYPHATRTRPLDTPG